MNDGSLAGERRVLIVDDSAAIHDDFRKILSVQRRHTRLAEHEAELFGESGVRAESRAFALDFAFQGDEALRMVQEAVAAERPYAMAFVDVRMPPGWDGVETTARVWEVDADLHVVICTAYTDYTWEEIIERLGQSDRLVILKKPFDNIEVRQLACALAVKWNMTRELRGRMSDLEETVLVRTAELEEQKRSLQETVAQLQQAHSQLLQADKLASLGQLAAGVAHEINNPIGFISSNLNSLEQYVKEIQPLIALYDELAGACAEAPAYAERARRIAETRAACDFDYIMGDLGSLIEESRDGARRVRQIVADLRDFSHVDSPDVQEEDINELMDKTINVAWNELKYKAEVRREYGSIPAVPCFGGKLGQVFLNLLVNSAQAIRERGTITVRTGQEGETIWVEVADTGCGIPPEQVGRVFEPFFTTKEVGKGTGLGLHLAYNIVQAHGGRIQVQSRVGEGTTFRIELPQSGPAVSKGKHDEFASSKV